MRPINLKLEAFGSFVKPLEIDFEKGLDGAKIFLIHGATGAGKTTLLDAICYALYEQSSGGEKNSFYSEFAKDNQPMSVEFTFAMNNSIYRIKREPALKKGAKKLAEIYQDGNLKTSSAADTNTFVKNLLGFDATQFRQVVILPQGKFREFLTASSKEREEILSVIFNAEFYSQIEKRLNRKADEAKSEKEKLEKVQEIYSQHLAVDGQELSAQVEELKISVEKNKLAYEQAQKELDIGKILSDAFKQFEEHKEKFLKADKKLKYVTEKISSAKVELEKRNAEEVTRQDLSNKISDLEKISVTISEYQKKVEEFQKANDEKKVEEEKVLRQEKKVKNYEDQLQVRKDEIESLQGAEGKFKDAEKILERSQDKNNRLREIEKLEKILAKSQIELQVAEKNYSDADEKVQDLRHLQREGRAAILAKNLSDGEPCPVCGSVHHPNLAIFSKLLPTDKNIEDAEKNLKVLEKQKNKSTNELSTVEEKIKICKSEITKLSDVLEIEEAKKIFDRAKGDFDKFKDSSDKLKKGEKLTQNERDKLDELKKDFETRSRSAENLRVVVETMQKQIPQEYLINAEKISADLREKQKLLESLTLAWKEINTEYNKLQQEKSAQEALIKTEKNACEKFSAKIEGKDKPDIETLQKNVKSAHELHIKSIAEQSDCQAKLKQFTESKNKFDALQVQIDEAEKVYEMWQHLSDVANGKLSDTKISFRRSYLQSIFRDIVEESNARLDKMSEGRYKFVFAEEKLKGAKTGGLDIKIFDAYTGKARVATTLSGGESFLAALSLALGLAAVVKNISGGVKLDTLFIDEGFGSLDSDALDAAIEVLENLQAGGRLVGIISHVDELKQRLPARLEVKKSQRGSWAEFVK